MAPVQHGIATRHIILSNGAECNPSKFYVSEYSIAHGRKGFLPTVGKHHGTGYKSNFRPGLYYNQKLDEIDNPSLRNLTQENYKTTHAVDFQPTPSQSYDSRKDTFPRPLVCTKRCFEIKVEQTLPLDEKFRNSCVNPVLNDQTKPVTCLLSNLQNKNPITVQENCHQINPPVLPTEYKTRFLGVADQRMDTSEKIVGPKKGSGFTRAHRREPITYSPNDCFDGINTSHRKSITTGDTIMKSSFTPIYSINAKTNKPELKLLSKRAERNTGYTRGTQPKPAYAHERLATYTRLSELERKQRQRVKKNDMAEYFDCVYAYPYPSMAFAAFQKTPPDENYIGMQRSIFHVTKQKTGFTHNNCNSFKNVDAKSLRGAESLKRFQTHYHSHYEKYPTNNKNSRTATSPINQDNFLEQQSNGFSKSTHIHSFDEQDKPRNTVASQSLHPYVAKSIAIKNPQVTRIH